MHVYYNIPFVNDVLLEGLAKGNKEQKWNVKCHYHIDLLLKWIDIMYNYSQKVDCNSELTATVSLVCNNEWNMNQSTLQ